MVSAKRRPGSLRVRLVAGTLVLLVAAVVTTDLVTYSSLRSFLLGKLDAEIGATQSKDYSYLRSTYLRDLRRDPGLAAPGRQRAWLAGLQGSAPGGCLVDPLAPLSPTSTIGRAPASTGSPSTTPAAGPAPSSSTAGTSVASAGSGSEPSGRRTPGRGPLGDRLAALTSPNAYVEVLAGNRLVYVDPSGSCPPDPAPVLPAHLPVQAQPAAHPLGARRGPFVPSLSSFDTASTARGIRYRAQAIAVPGGTLVTAVPLQPTMQTLASVVHVELLVSLAVLVGVVLLGLVVVRLGLRPLQDITVTAGAIAAGDLGRRVQPSHPGSEVGRLGLALNGMLAQIEAAFSQRTAAEARLRRFVADASHELRTPLTSIRGYAELLRKGALPDEDQRRRAAQRIEHEAARMGLLVDDLLLLARLDRGRALQHRPVDLARVAEEAVDAARAVHRHHQLQLRSEAPVVVLGDADRLRQVVDNLLHNAALHTPEGTRVDVSVGVAGERAVLQVRDDGPGLEPEQAARVFDRFYRGRRAPVGEGSGLGLAIVAALAQAHGGSASVESMPGAGATFTVELPLSGPEAVGYDPGRPGGPGAGNGAGTGGGNGGGNGAGGGGGNGAGGGGAEPVVPQGPDARSATRRR